MAVGDLRGGGWALTWEDCLGTWAGTGTLEGCLGAGTCWPEIRVLETTLEVASASPCSSAGAMGTPSGGASRITAGGSSGASWSSSAGAGAISSMGARSGGASAPSTPPGSAPPAWASCCHPCRKIDALGIQSQPSTTKGAHPSPHPSIHPPPLPWGTHRLQLGHPDGAGFDCDSPTQPMRRGVWLRDRPGLLCK